MFDTQVSDFGGPHTNLQVGGHFQIREMQGSQAYQHDLRAEPSRLPPAECWDGGRGPVSTSLDTFSSVFSELSWSFSKSRNQKKVEEGSG